MSLKNKLIKKIASQNNCIRIDKFISFTLNQQNAYYRDVNPLGKKGDFITAPEISQMFGEILGVFLLNYWQENIKKKFNLVELGPGKGTLLQDILRVFQIDKSIKKSINVKLIEINNKLIKIQKKRINSHKLKNINWLSNFKIRSRLPCIIYANEFFDCLPIRQFYKNNYWYEKYVTYNKSLNIFSYKDKKITTKTLLSELNDYNNEKLAEISYEREKLFKKLCKHIYYNKGLVIIIDYGYNKPINNFTLQAISRHKKTHIFDNIGSQDITSLVNFNKMIQIAKHSKLKVVSYKSQREFLFSNGIIERKKFLKKNLSKDEKILIDEQFNKLTDLKEMGKNFKFLVVSS